MIIWDKVTDNKKVIELIKLREKINDEIRAIDETALLNYELQVLGYDE